MDFPEGDVDTPPDLDENLDIPFTIFVITPKEVRIPLQVSLMDNVQDIQQFLCDHAETCCVTSYHLQLNNSMLNVYSELAELLPLNPGSEILMVEDEYSKRTAHIHLRRIQSILSMVPSVHEPHSLSFFSHLTNIDFPDAGEEFDLSQLLPEINPATNCLKTLQHSGWNPPTGARKLQGDLLYLDVTFLEGDLRTITCWTNGFYINSSEGTKFDPNPLNSVDLHHDLVDLLSAHSPLFNENFRAKIGQLQNLLSSANSFRIFSNTHPSQLLPVPMPVTNWIAPKPQDSYHVMRAERAWIEAIGANLNIQGQIRDWNEELQVCRQLPRHTAPERILRDRAIHGVQTEFIAAATFGAKEIIHGVVPPLNPQDSNRAAVFICNNIFYSYVNNLSRLYQGFSERETSDQLLALDLQGVSNYNNADVLGLFTLATCLIDYEGHRLMAQSIFPGLFSDPAVQIVYGFDDAGALQVDSEFDCILAEAGRVLSIEPHLVTDKVGNSCMISSHADIKGIRGSDGRLYILDLVFTTPHDLNYPTNMTTRLRPELIKSYIQAINSQQTGKTFAPCFNVDIGTSHIVQISNKNLSNIKRLASYLTKILIPNFVNDILNGSIWPHESQTLCAVLHERGINLRYLGVITTSIMERTKKGSQNLTQLFLSEMVIRVTKRMFQEHMKACSRPNLADLISKLLNFFFNRKNQKISQAQWNDWEQTTIETSRLSALSLWGTIKTRIKRKYDFKLPFELPKAIFGYPTLRSLCQRVGIQLLARDYNFNKDPIFRASDVVDLFPVVKHTLQTITKDGNDLLEAGKSALGQNQISVAFELLTEALAVFQQVHGPMRAQTARCYSYLARLLAHTGDLHQAILYQRQAVIIYERVEGFDHFDTIHAYGNLAAFTHQLCPSPLSLQYLYHVSHLHVLVSQLKSSDIVITYLNLGMALQDLNRIPQSRNMFLTALKENEALNGVQNLQTANICHLLAISYSLQKDYKNAVLYQKKNKEILLGILGPKDMRTMQSSLWLDQFGATCDEPVAAIMETHGTGKPQKAVPPPTQQPLPKLEMNPGLQLVGSTEMIRPSLPIASILNFILEPQQQRHYGPGRLRHCAIPTLGLGRVGSLVKQERWIGKPTPTTPLNRSTNSARAAGGPAKTQPKKETPPVPELIENFQM